MIQNASAALSLSMRGMDALNVKHAEESSMKQFKLISRENIFTLLREFDMLGIHCVEGVTKIKDKEFSTIAREADIQWIKSNDTL
jgi:hypothetical protein